MKLPCKNAKFGYNVAMDKYRELLNLPGALFTKIDHAEAMVATVYKVSSSQGEFILKVSDRRGDYLREIFFLNHIGTPKIVQTLPAHGAILMECLPGRLLQPADLTETLAHEIGRRLAEIHLHRLPGYGDPVSGPLNPDPRVYFTLKFEEGLKECEGNLPSALLNKCERYYNDHADLLMSLDGPCIAHRDFRPGNLMVFQGKLAGVIDWAGARASFAEEDLCCLEHGEWANIAVKPLLNGYAAVRPLPPYARLAPFLRMNRAIATIGFTVKRGSWENKNAALYQYNRLFLEKLHA